MAFSSFVYNKLKDDFMKINCWIPNKIVHELFSYAVDGNKL